MADSVDVKVTGLEDVQKSIKDLLFASPEDIKRGVLRVAMKIERQAKANVPVDTGRLRGSISENWTNSGKSRGDVDGKAAAEDGVGQPPVRRDTFTAVVGTNVEYAPFVEFNDKAQHEVGSAHFLYGAYFSYEGDVAEEVKNELAKRLASMLKR